MATMALVNIGEGNRDDGFYRYKMPKLQTKIEGRGNGIKTNLVNMVEVAKALARPPAYTTKFFGCVLGAQSKYDEKTLTSTVNGAHETSKLVQLLEIFIKKYVQCYGCGNPETEIVITKTQMITLKCAACGYLSDVDMRDKLTTFIINNPPETKKVKGTKQMRKAEKERLKAGEAADEEAKSSKKVSGKKKGDESAKKTKKKDDEEKILSPDASQKDEDEQADDDDVEWQTDTSRAAAEQRRLEQLSAATSEMVMLELEETQNGTSKKSKEKSLKKGSKDEEDSVQSPDAGKKNGIDKKSSRGEGDEDDQDGEEENEQESEFDGLFHDLKDYSKTHTLAETANYLQNQGEFTEVLSAALFQALFDGLGKGLSKEVAKKKVLLSKVLQEDVAQGRFLGAVERYCGVVRPDAVKETALVLKVLYDNDIMEEEQIMTWYSKKGGNTELGISAGAAAAVRKEAAPFVKWLQEAEAESDEE